MLAAGGDLVLLLTSLCLCWFVEVMNGAAACLWWLGACGYCCAAGGNELVGWEAEPVACLCFGWGDEPVGGGGGLGGGGGVGFGARRVSYLSKIYLFNLGAKVIST